MFLKVQFGSGSGTFAWIQNAEKVGAGSGSGSGINHSGFTTLN